MTSKSFAQKSVAVLVTLALTGTVPGFEFYQAAAASVSNLGASVVPGIGAVPVVPAAALLPGGLSGVQGILLDAGRNLRVDSSALPVPAGLRPIRTLQGLPSGRVPSAGVRSTLPSGRLPSEPVRSLQALPQSLPSAAAARMESRSRILENIAAESPDFGRMSSGGASTAAETDFYAKIRQTFRLAGQGEPVVPAVRHAVAAAPAGTVRQAGVFAAANGVSRSSSKRSRSRMPEEPGDLDGDGSDSPGVPDPDGSLNPRRQDDGPDSVSDEPSRDSGGSELFSYAAMALAPGLAAGIVAPQVLLAGSIAWFGIVVPSLVLHEYAHGLVASLLGDPTPRNAGRLSLNPLRHIDLKMTVLLPIALSLFGLPPVGAAKPVPVDPSNFKRPDAGLALTALTGPAVNFGLALLGVALFHGLAMTATPLAPLAMMALYMGIRINLVLGLFNLLPVPGFDGGNILRSILPRTLQTAFDHGTTYLKSHPVLKVAGFGALLALALPLLGSFTGFLANSLMGFTAASSAGGIQMASATLPALALASLSLMPLAGPFSMSRQFSLRAYPHRVPSVLEDHAKDRVKILVEMPEGVRWQQDYHVDWVDWSRPNAMEDFQDAVGGMYSQLEKAGLSPELLQGYEAVPVANYKLIRTATLSVPKDQKAALEARLKELGLATRDNRRIEIVKPVEPSAASEPAARSVTLKDVAKLTGADKVQEILKKEMESAIDPTHLHLPGFLRTLTLKAMGWLGITKKPYNPAGSVIDTGVDAEHPMLKGHIQRPARDGHGHGTWVASAVLSFDPAQTNLRAYNTFENGGANTDDILRDLTKADSEGAEWFTNSWGDSEGDPNAPEAKLVLEIAKKGKIQFFAAGNQGSDDNTVGGPAIAYYRDPKTGTDVIVSVGATDADGKTAYFQSRGPWSPYVSGNKKKFPGYPNRVDIQSVGHNVYGAYPTYMEGADKVDPELGPQKKSSGTSMSTPTLGGAFSLLREFGFAPTAIVKALFENAKKTGKPEAEGGRGFLDVYAAYQALKKAQDVSIGGRIRALLRPAALKVATALTHKAARMDRAVKTAAVSLLDKSLSQERVKILVKMSEQVRWKQDYHVDWVDLNQPNASEAFQETLGAMYAQLEQTGLTPELLQGYEAVPVANYKLIRTATLSVPKARLAALEGKLREMGLTVRENRMLRIIKPVDANAPDKREAPTVSLSEVAKLTGADKVQEILKKETESALDIASLNLPGFVKTLTLKGMALLGIGRKPVSAPGSVIDTGVDPDHPMLKGHIERPARDGHGHGTWVASAVVSFDPWQKNLRAYNTFETGGASTDDILRDLSQADKDGAEWFTNSWGDSYGDPNAPEAELVRQIAAKGKIFFFAAGNEGSGDNTVGGPAIAYYRDSKTGTDMIVSVGATDAAKETAWFQSRGPWSPYVSENQDKFPGYPNRVDIQSVGHKVYGAYPTYMEGADKVDPELGPQKESSGTSMSTPTLGGAYSLLREFGFAPTAIVKALLESAKNLGKPEAEGGKGFLDVYAAYQALKKAQKASLSGRIAALLRGTALTAAMVLLSQPAMAAMPQGAHTAIKAGLFGVGGAFIGFAIGASIGWKTSNNRNHSGSEIGAGLGILFDMITAGFFGLVGALVLGIGGAVLGAAVS